MNKGIFILILISGMARLFGQSPHGDKLVVDCKACHNSGSWDYTANEALFSHDQTEFALEGAHEQIQCKDCHNSLVFDQADGSCVSCHTDVHSMSVGNDCVRCHNSENWLVDNIPELHEENGFPLVGAHRLADCTDCHQSETNLRWDRIGNDCASCHMSDFQSTQNPNHAATGFSTDCAMCHDAFGMDWGAGNFHFFFPLTGGHDINDCNACHNGNNYSEASPQCVSCHLDDFTSVTNPNHVASGFSQECTLCHSTNAWKPASFEQHDNAYFPIYSGNHNGEWNACTDCHTTSGNYALFSCIDCHEHNNAADLADEHDDVSGYSFNSQACFNCHPKGEE